MHSLLYQKLKEATASILPISIIVLIFMLIPSFGFETSEILIFVGSTIILILGIALFSLGAELAMSPMGEQVGSSIIKTKKIWLILGICFILGLLITIAEPDLSVLASQVSSVFGSKIMIILFVGVGVALFLVFAIIKMIFKKDLSFMLMIFYFIIFAITSVVVENGNSGLLPLAFDSGGVTTGPITVPFLMALGIGVAATIGGRDQKENSFGLIALCSVGPVLAILILSILPRNGLPIIDSNYGYSSSLIKTIFASLINNAREVGIALVLIVFAFLLIDFIYIHLSKKKMIHLLVGIVYTFVGLVFFLTAVQIGFMPTGYKLGSQMVRESQELFIIFGLAVGSVTVIAEPAIRVLTKQVEEVTTGGISKRSLLIALAIGVGVSICLSCVRIIFKFSILYYIVPGYAIALGLSLFVPKIYTSIAFDSGGVASGPLTSSFILPFAIGACATLNGASSTLEFAFGLVAMVAMTPLIAVQVLGFKDVLKKQLIRKKRVKQLEYTDDDERIITFN